jgi:hypothetical protein
MAVTIMWLLIAVCLCRCLYVSIRDRNYAHIAASFVLLIWAIYKTAILAGLVPAAYIFA